MKARLKKNPKKKKSSLYRIISGGQTGVDRAALDAALKLDFPCGGWCPKGRLAEEGPIPRRYPLKETPLKQYPQRTRWNVRDSDGTLILTWGEPQGGTRLTLQIAKKLKKPTCVMDLDLLSQASVGEVLQWIEAYQIGVLNIAGPRASFGKSVYSKAYSFVQKILERVLC